MPEIGNQMFPNSRVHVACNTCTANFSLKAIPKISRACPLPSPGKSAVGLPARTTTHPSRQLPVGCWPQASLVHSRSPTEPLSSPELWLRAAQPFYKPCQPPPTSPDSLFFLPSPPWGLEPLPRKCSRDQPGFRKG